MKRGSLDAIPTAARAIDLAALLAAFGGAAWLGGDERGSLPFHEVLALRIKLQNFLIFLGLLTVWMSVLSGFGLYHSHIYRSRAREMKDVVAAVSVCAVSLWVLTLVAQIELIGPDFLLYFWLLALGLSLAARLSMRFALRQTRRGGRNLRQLLIVGSNRRAIALAQRIESIRELGYRLVGFVDDDWSGSEALRRAGYSLVANFASFSEFIARNVVDEVMVCIPVKSLYERSSQILAQCAEQGITARFVSDVFTPTVGRSYTERFDGRLVLTIETNSMRGWAVIAKRLIDFVLAAILVIALTPLFLTIAALVKLRSPGPVFFVQERMGLNKRRFHLYKFRTMVLDAEKRMAELQHLNEVDGPAFKIRDDPRVTRLGHFLRKTSLDELPQLFNVLKGDMSLVGPRPLPIRDYEAFSTAWHRRRFSVKPGITCLWQVMGRNDIPFERWMELDMQYIDEWSLLLDLQILLKTIPAVMKRSGAS
jgi:exopolysaccharide biosynthesis polyprenyl glycosylphosphotransferase